MGVDGQTTWVLRLPFLESTIVLLILHSRHREGGREFRSSIRSVVLLSSCSAPARRVHTVTQACCAEVNEGRRRRCLDSPAAARRVPWFCCGGHPPRVRQLEIDAARLMSATSTSCSDASSEDSDTAEAAEAARRAAWFSEVDGREEEKTTKGAALFGDAPLQPPAAERLVAEVDFSASVAFAGQREGWVFRVGANGTGYYRDMPPATAQNAADGGSAELFGYLDHKAGATRSFDESAGSSHQRSDSRDHGAADDGDSDNEDGRTGGLRLRHLESVRDGLLGEGAQSRVYLYRHPNPPSGHAGELQYAVKTIQKAGLSERAAARIVDEKAALSATNALWARSQTTAADTVRSASGRQILPAPPVVRLLGTDQDHEQLYLIQEFLSKGQLTELVRAAKPHLFGAIVARFGLCARLTGQPTFGVDRHHSRQFWRDTTSRPWLSQWI